MKEPTCRADVFDVSVNRIKTVGDMISEADACTPLTWELQRIYSEERDQILQELEALSDKETTRKKRAALEAKLEQMPEEPEDGISEWLERLEEKRLPKIRKRIRAWLGERPDWNNEDDYFEDYATAQSAALVFFEQMDRETLDKLGVEIVEGDRPGSTYYAAELHKSISEANHAAEEAGLAIRFIKSS